MKTKTPMVVGKRAFTSGSGSGLCYLIHLKDQAGKGCHEGVPACLSTQLVAVAAASPHSFPSSHRPALMFLRWSSTILKLGYSASKYACSCKCFSKNIFEHFCKLKRTFLINNGASFQMFSSLLAICSKHCDFSLPVAVHDIQEFDFPRGFGYRHQGDRIKPV